MTASRIAGLKEVDPEVFAAIRAEEERREDGLELIASENFISRAVMVTVRISFQERLEFMIYVSGWVAGSW